MQKAIFCKADDSHEVSSLIFAYSNISKISPQETESRNSDIFHISAQNIGGSNEYPQSMFLSINKKNNVYPCKPQFYYIHVKVGFQGVKII